MKRNHFILLAITLGLIGYSRATIFTVSEPTALLLCGAGLIILAAYGRSLTRSASRHQEGQSGTETDNSKPLPSRLNPTENV